MRLIDADALKAEIKKDIPAKSNWGDIFIPQIIDSQPTIDAQPVRHGHWIDFGDPMGWQCSQCGYVAVRYNNTSYCPRCGSCMDEDGDTDETN